MQSNVDPGPNERPLEHAGVVHSAANHESAATFCVSALRTHERDELLAWLNRGLRNGRPARLEAEFHSTLFSGDPERDRDCHVLVRDRGRFASHCLVRSIDAEAMGSRIRLGLIGMVYTDPGARGRGAARLALEASVERLSQQGANLAVLWSDLDDFYARLGFERAGIENVYLLDRELCNAACTDEARALEVRDAEETDWPGLERLYDAKPSRHVRAAGELERLAAAPDTRTLVALREGEPLGYAAMGRGDDLTGVVHEWAGDENALVACLARFAETNPEIVLLEGPTPERPTRPLRRCGARPQPGSFALMRILDVENLWSALIQGSSELQQVRLGPDPSGASDYVLETPERTFALSHQSTLSLLFGPAMPRTLSLGLDNRTRAALARRFPWPLFIWGFDSI